MAWTETALDRLRNASGRSGGARRLVVELLGDQDCCLSAHEIHDRVRARGARVGIASVYRALDGMDELGLVQRVDLGDGVARYEPAHAGGTTITISSATTAARSSLSKTPRSSRQSSESPTDAGTSWRRTTSSCAGRARIADRRVSDATARTTIHDLLREARSRFVRLDPVEALEAQRAGALVIDTRSSDDRHSSGCIPGSVHIPRTVLEWRLDPDAQPAYRSPHVTGLEQQLVLICSHGLSSSLAAATLQELGFRRATDVVGGFLAWRDAGLPVRSARPADPTAVPGLGDPEPS